MMMKVVYVPDYVMEFYEPNQPAPVTTLSKQTIRALVIPHRSSSCQTKEQPEAPEQMLNKGKCYTVGYEKILFFEEKNPSLRVVIHVPQPSPLAGVPLRKGLNPPGFVPQNVTSTPSPTTPHSAPPFPSGEKSVDTAPFPACKTESSANRTISALVNMAKFGGKTRPTTIQEPRAMSRKQAIELTESCCNIGVDGPKRSDFRMSNVDNPFLSD
jgi:hypothetical protein